MQIKDLNELTNLDKAVFKGAEVRKGAFDWYFIDGDNEITSEYSAMTILEIENWHYMEIVYDDLQKEWVKKNGVKEGDCIKVTAEFTKGDKGYTHDAPIYCHNYVDCYYRIRHGAGMDCGL